MSAIAICVNPMSGRDVRRLAARATNMTHEAKRDIVARIAAGADSIGVNEIYIVDEPFRIASMALDWMPLKAKVISLGIELRHDASDTERAVRAFVGEGVEVIVSLGGDGTNRIIARSAPQLDLIALSTGTNNVFPSMVEPTTAGMVAALAAMGRFPEESAFRIRTRAKVLHTVFSDGISDIALIDAVQLRDDHVGNLLPYDEAKIMRMLLTRALPDTVGMSPVGGLISVVEEKDDCGLLVEIGEKRDSDMHIKVPLSPGFFKEVAISSSQRVDLGESVTFEGEGILALDGDREHKLANNRSVSATIRRDGPWVYDVGAAMRYAVAEGMMLRPL
ncbi:MAG: NAD(+)/NADH kinase [Pseudomonadota bacterium]|nr:NAD(+)/NADH kinase [Pseudomonadota bacterium]